MHHTLRKITLVLICCCRLITPSNITMVNNAIFNPIDNIYCLGNLSDIKSLDVCICRCYTNLYCSTACYSGLHQMCFLYSADIWQGELILITISENTTVISLGNRNQFCEYNTNSMNTCIRKLFEFYPN